MLFVYNRHRRTSSSSRLSISDIKRILQLASYQAIQYAILNGYDTTRKIPLSNCLVHPTMSFDSESRMLTRHSKLSKDRAYHFQRGSCRKEIECRENGT